MATWKSKLDKRLKKTIRDWETGKSINPSIRIRVNFSPTVDFQKTVKKIRNLFHSNARGISVEALHMYFGNIDPSDIEQLANFEFVIALGEQEQFV